MPQKNCRAQWLKNTPEVVSETSATAYFFADYLQQVLDVPIGIIVSSWGGTSIQAWMSREVLAPFKAFDRAFLMIQRSLNGRSIGLVCFTMR